MFKVFQKNEEGARGVYGFPHREFERIVRFEEDEPFEILGPHPSSGKMVQVRSFLPRAVDAWIRLPGSGMRRPMKKVHPKGIFEVVVKSSFPVMDYRVGFHDENGFASETEDPYAFRPEISDLDLFLIGEGNHFNSYKKFGAQLTQIRGVSGVHFSVWAPNAKSVSVVGNFNHWIPGAHPMARIHFSGVWGLFIPGIDEGELYKFAIRSSADHEVRIKTDPYAFRAELRPRTASIVSNLDRYQWNDEAWMQNRAKDHPLAHPISVYEIHLGSWMRDEKNGWGFMDYRELAGKLVSYVKYMGYTHVELLPVMEHPLDESWGYQVVNYYAPTSRFGDPEGFMYLVDLCHQHGIGVILDWVPAHFPKDSYGLVDFDGRQIYAYENWKKGEHRDWGTLVFDYGKREVQNFLISNALFWMDKYHVDGLRVDAVASILYLDYSRKPGEWEPNVYGGRENLEAVAFLKKFNEVVHARYPGILTIAEESTAWPNVTRPTFSGGLGFDLKWNMGWMHDTLEYFSKDPVYRKFHHGNLTFSMWYQHSENFVLPISHDEVVHGKGSLIGKMPGDDMQKFANLRLFLGYMFAHPGKKLLFMGSDLAQWSEWNLHQSIDWHFLQFSRHRRINQVVKDLNRLYRDYPAFHEGDLTTDGFEWIDFSDEMNSVISFLRWSRDRKQLLIFTFNMTPVIRENYRIGVPWHGFYKEIFNSEAFDYGGCGLGNQGGIHSENIPMHKRPHSLNCQLPPLGVNIFCFCP